MPSGYWVQVLPFKPVDRSLSLPRWPDCRAVGVRGQFTVVMQVYIFDLDRWDGLCGNGRPLLRRIVDRLKWNTGITLVLFFLHSQWLPLPLTGSEIATISKLLN